MQSVVDNHTQCTFYNRCLQNVSFYGDTLCFQCILIWIILTYAAIQLEALTQNSQIQTMKSQRRIPAWGGLLNSEFRRVQQINMATHRHTYIRHRSVFWQGNNTLLITVSWKFSHSTCRIPISKGRRMQHEKWIYLQSSYLWTWDMVA